MIVIDEYYNLFLFCFVLCRFLESWDAHFWIMIYLCTFYRYCYHNVPRLITMNIIIINYQLIIIWRTSYIYYFFIRSESRSDVVILHLMFYGIFRVYTLFPLQLTLSFVHNFTHEYFLTTIFICKREQKEKKESNNQLVNIASEVLRFCSLIDSIEWRKISEYKIKLN